MFLLLMLEVFGQVTSSADLCSSLSMKEVGKKTNYCQDTSGRGWQVSKIADYKIMIIPENYQEDESPKICSDYQETDLLEEDDGTQMFGRWKCKSVIFIVTRSQLLDKQKTNSRVPREAARKDVEFSTIEVAGGQWVCEKISETECKPLWPKKSPKQEEGLQSRSLNRQKDKEQYSSGDSNLFSSGVVNDNDRWRWTGGGGGRSAPLVQKGPSDGENYVYNINGITWLCRQFKQLQCYPTISAPAEPSPSPKYPDYPGQDIPPPQTTPAFKTTPRTNRRIVTEITVVTERERTKLDPSTTPRTKLYGPLVRPPHKRTSFCSREIRFEAKDEVVLRYNTFTGSMQLYIQAVRLGGGLIELKTRMLRPGESGLGAEENIPPVLMKSSVNCDRITVMVETELGSQEYILDYDFGRKGVRDLEVVGNLESTGMVPRSHSRDNQGTSGGVANFMSNEDFNEIQLQPSPVGVDVQPIIEIVDIPEEENDEEPIPVAEDNFQIDGKGDVQLSLGEAGQDDQHRYQISRTEDGEVNVEVLVDGSTTEGQRRLVIDNTDYNYTLIVTGENFQIIHHDTKKNLTYKHGLNEEDISGVGVSGTLQGTSTSFKEKPALVGTARLFPTQTQKPLQGVSIFGNLCLGVCSPTCDSIHCCQITGGKTEQCGPNPNVTPFGETCTSECRKREDSYFWCHTNEKPWDYCSPPLVFQQSIPCPSTAARQTTPDPTDCARYLTCEAGRVKLEECPEGLHYIHRKRTCEWPTGQSCSNPFDRSASQTQPPTNRVQDVKNPNPISLLTSIVVPKTTPQPTKPFSIVTENSAGESFLNTDNTDDSLVTNRKDDTINEFTVNNVMTSSERSSEIGSGTSEIFYLGSDKVGGDLNSIREVASQNELSTANRDERQSTQVMNEVAKTTPVQISNDKDLTNNFPSTFDFKTSTEGYSSSSDEKDDYSMVSGQGTDEIFETAEGINRPVIWGQIPPDSPNSIRFSTEGFRLEETTVWTPKVTENLLGRSNRIEGRTIGNTVRFPSSSDQNDKLETLTIPASERNPLFDQPLSTNFNNLVITEISSNRSPTQPGKATPGTFIDIPSSFNSFRSSTTDISARTKSRGRIEATRAIITTTPQATTITTTTTSTTKSTSTTTTSTTTTTTVTTTTATTTTTTTFTTSSTTTTATIISEEIDDTSDRASLPRRLFSEPGGTQQGIGNSLEDEANKDKDTTNSVPKGPKEVTEILDDVLDKAMKFQGGLTSHGELCTDACEKRGYSYYWCHKRSSSLGQWSDSDFCSPTSTVTHYGKECSDECTQRGEVYFWCSRRVDGGWGFCSPGTVYKQGVCEKNDGFYSLVGDCERYISCRDGRPIPFSCEKTLFFDFILKSCTFKKDARCIGV